MDGLKLAGSGVDTRSWLARQRVDGSLGELDVDWARLQASASVPELVERVSTVDVPVGVVDMLNKRCPTRRSPMTQDTRLIVVSHQPTAFGYFGVYGLFALAEAVCRGLRTAGRDAAVVYLCLDSDDAADRRIAHAKVATPFAPCGAVSLSCLESDVANRPQRLAPTPSSHRQDLWVEQVTSAFAGSVPRSLRRAKLAFLESVRGLVAGSAAAWQEGVLLHFLETELGLVPIVVRSSDLCRRFPLGVVDVLETVVGRRVGEAASLLWAVCPRCLRRCRVENAGPWLGALRARCLPCGVEFESCLEDAIPRVAVEDLMPQMILGAALTLVYAGGAEHVLGSQIAAEASGRGIVHSYVWEPQVEIRTEMARLIFEGGVSARGASAALQRLNSGRDSLLGVVGEWPDRELGNLIVEGFLSHGLAPFVVQKQR